MNTRTIEEFKTLNADVLETVEGGLVWWAIPAGVTIYGIVAGYTDEKCIMDNGKHWYCAKLP
ncbi:ComC/BlpC family leader-containing pheromone/bacteriocin [Streptococcus suis]